MTKVAKKIVKCAKCGEESEQLIVYSVNFMLDEPQSNDMLKQHKQTCPKCNYTNSSITILTDNNK